MVNCSKDDFTFGSLQVLQICSSRGLVKQQQPNGDGSGKVKFTATADNDIL
jgi:hypothetical protein